MIKDFRWEAYKVFFQIQIFKYLVTWFSLVPILASVINDFPPQITIAIYHQELVLNLSLPFSWELLWISSFFFVCALILYYIFCPAFVRKYHSFGDYKTYKHDQRWLVFESLPILTQDKDSKEKTKFVRRLAVKNYAIEIPTIPNGKILNKRYVEGSSSEVYFKSNEKLFKFELPVYQEQQGKRIVDGEAERGVFWELYSVYSGNKLIARKFILALLLCSLLAFLWVLFTHLYAGFRYAFF